MTRAIQAPSVKKRAVILVHGMGASKRGTMLLTVADAFAVWMDHNRLEPKIPSKQPQLDERLSDAGPPSVVLSFADQQWKLVEAWWAESFIRPLFDPMVGWTVQRFMAHLGRLGWTTVFHTLVPFLQATLLLLAYPLGFLLVLSLLSPLLLFLFLILPVVLIVPVLLQNWTSRTFGVVVVLVIFGGLSSVYYVFSRPDTILEKIVSAVLFGLILPFLTRFMAEPTPPTTTGATDYGRRDLSLLLKVADYDPVSAITLQEVAARPESLLREYPWLDPRYFLRHGAAIAWRLISRLLVGSLKDVDERILMERLLRPQCRVWEKARLGLLLAALAFFHIFNSLVTVALYLTGVVLIVPIMFLVWLLSRAGGIPRVSSVVNFIKGRLDSFLVGSLGDIKVFMDEPVQAGRIRRELERALDAVHSDLEFHDADIWVVTHSTGAPIAFETIVLGSNLQRRAGVKGLITVGSILAMALEMGGRRSSFEASLPRDVRWINIWTRYDPAMAGPLSRRQQLRALRGGLLATCAYRWRRLAWYRRIKLRIFRWLHQLRRLIVGGRVFSCTAAAPRIADIPVSNEDDPFNDHSAYWNNDHQVIPRLVSEIWGDDAPRVFDFSDGRELQRVRNRKYRILALSSFRMVVWLLFPLTFWVTLVFVNNMSTAKDVAGNTVVVLQRGAPLSDLLNVWVKFWHVIIRYDNYPVVGSVLLQPSGWLEKGFTALVLALFITFGAYLVYKFLRAILWDGFFQGMAIFRA